MEVVLESQKKIRKQNVKNVQDQDFWVEVLMIFTAVLRVMETEQ